MDLYCPHCGEPWDLSEMTEEGVTLSDFRHRGCRAFGVSCEDVTDDRTAAASRVSMELMGDDVDGIASVMND